MKKKFKLFLAAGVIAATISVHHSHSFAYFSDMENHYAKEAVEVWNRRGIVTGYQGRFHPQKTITRGEAAVFLDRLMNYRGEGSNRFSDLKESYYTSAILRLNKRGILQGSKGMIRPEEPITREEMAVLFAKLFDMTGIKGGGDFFDDSKISTWAQPFVNQLKKEGYITGYQGKFHPKTKVTRAEFISLLNNMVADVVKEPKDIDATHYKKGFLLIQSGNVKVRGLDHISVVIAHTQDSQIEFVDSKINSLTLEDGTKNVKVKLSRSSYASLQDRSQDVTWIDDKNRLIDGLTDPHGNDSLVPLPQPDQFRPIEPKSKSQRDKSHKRDRLNQEIPHEGQSEQSGEKKEENNSPEPNGPQNEDKTQEPEKREEKDPPVQREEPKENGKENENNQTDKEEKPKQPDMEEDNEPNLPEISKEYVVILPNLKPDGSLYYPQGKEVQLPETALIGLKKTGENGGEPFLIKWSSDEMERLREGVKGLYIVEVTTEQELVINGKNYGVPRFFIEIVVA